MYGVTTDGSLKTALKASSEPKELLGASPFKEMLEEILALLAPPPHGGPAAMEIVQSTETDSVAVDGLTLETLAVPAEVLQKHESSLTTWLATLREHQSTFVRLISQGDGSVGQISALLDGSVVKHLGADQRLLIFYDTKCAGEASAQAHVRLPGFGQERFKTMMQSVLTTRKDLQRGQVRAEPRSRVQGFRLLGDRTPNRNKTCRRIPTPTDRAAATLS